MAVNVGFYEFAVNQDPEGEDQLSEWQRTTRIFRHTTGVLCGHLVALITGAALVRRHSWPVVLAIAALLGTALAVTAFVAGQLLGRVGESINISYTPTDDPVFVSLTWAQHRGGQQPPCALTWLVHLDLC